MKQKSIFSLLVLLSLAFSVAAQKAQLQKSDVIEKNLRSHVEYLASDKLDGRRTGETGATYAAGYIANLFANYKLKTGFNQTANGKTKQNYLQTFPFVTNVEVASDGNDFRFDAADGGQKMNSADASDFKPVAFSPNASIGNTAAVFVNYGIVSDELKIDDYKNQTITGRFVVAFDGTPENDNPHSLFARFNIYAKALIAKEKGAVGLILISREANLADDKLARLSFDQASGEAALPTVIVSRKIGAKMLETDENGLKAVQESAAAMVIAMTKGATGGTSKTAPLKTKAVINLKINLLKKSADAYNVVGVLEGTDAALKSEAVIIGAHYDHLGRGGIESLAPNSKEIHHGADDNASGVAALLELARQFSQNRTNKRTIVFIAFGGEEEGLLGSKFYTNNPAFPLEKTVAMINMDMIGRLQNDKDGYGKLTVGGIGTASEWKNLVEQKSELASSNAPVHGYNEKGEYVPIGQVTAKTKIFNLQLNEDGFGPSDHSSFYARKIPVLFFFTGTHGDYHKPSDTAEKINFEGLLRIENFVAEIIKSLVENPSKPTYTVAKSSGMGGRTTFNVSLGTVPNYADGNNDGLLLDGVRDDSPAQKAGLKAGDKITKINGREIRNIQDYTFVLGELKAGTEYEIEIARGAEKLTLKIVPAARK